MAELTNGNELIDAAPYGEHGAPHETWTRLRRESPLHRCEPEGFRPFWAVTKHADVCEISKQPELFLNAPGIVHQRLADIESGIGRDLRQMRTIIEMDPPQHRAYRRVGSPWFTPRALARLDALIEESARDVVDGLAEEGVCDFVPSVAAAHPLRILSSILGIPRADEPFVLKVTNELFGGEDPEFQRTGDRQEAVKQLGLEFFQYFSKIIADRREHPRDDLVSVFANAKLDGQPMGDMETFGYCLITFTAGHETTRNAISGGLLALIESPGELARLRRDPALAPRAIEEIVRWTTPVNYMQRTAARDTELRGRQIRAGDELILFYASANRDEEVFEAPFELRVDRHPNRHLGFGIGEHFCLGAHLARRSSAALFRELASRLESAELTAPPERLRSSFVVGLKHLPVHLRVRGRS